MRTSEEIAARVEALASGVLAWDMADWADWSEPEQHSVFALCLYELERRDRARREAQRRALRLLRSWLPPAQVEQFQRSRCFTVTGSAGGRYRLHPDTGTTQRVERHGKRDYAVESYCLHPPDQRLPPADISLAHYLLLVTDEPRFLALANAYSCRDRLWNGDYLRRLRAARREGQAREAAARLEEAA
jgi:hypothetical protein